MEDKYHIVKSTRELSTYLKENNNIIKSHMYYQRKFNKKPQSKNKTFIIDNIIIHYLSF